MFHFLTGITGRALQTIGCGTFVRNIIRTSNFVEKKVFMPGISWERIWCRVALFQMYGKAQLSDYMSSASMALFHLPIKVKPNRFSWMVNGTFLKLILKSYSLALPDGLFGDRYPNQKFLPIWKSKKRHVKNLVETGKKPFFWLSRQY